MLNKKAQKFIDGFKKELENHYVNKKKIKRVYDDWFNLIGFPRKKVEFYENKEGWYAAWDAARNAARDAAWDVAWYAVRDAAWDAAWYAARDAAWDAVEDAARDAAWDVAWYAARDAVRNAARDAAWDAVWNATWYAAWDATWDTIRNAACLNSCDKDDDCKICEFRRKFCEPAYNLFKNGVFIYWILKDKVIVITRPIIRHIGENLHSTSHPAIEWKNEKYYFLWGVRFDRELWEKVVKREMSFKEIMKLENIEQRMVALKMMDADKLLRESGAKLLDKSEKGNELYLVEGVFRQPAYFLKYVCPSTGRVYVSGVDPKVAKQSPYADYLMSWKLGITLEDYTNLIEA